jgi:hypothetical protein
MKSPIRHTPSETDASSTLLLCVILQLNYKKWCCCAPSLWLSAPRSARAEWKCNASLPATWSSQKWEQLHWIIFYGKHELSNMSWQLFLTRVLQESRSIDHAQFYAWTPTSSMAYTSARIRIFYRVLSRIYLEIARLSGQCAWQACCGPETITAVSWNTFRGLNPSIAFNF